MGFLNVFVNFVTELLKSFGVDFTTVETTVSTATTMFNVLLVYVVGKYAKVNEWLIKYLPKTEHRVAVTGFISVIISGAVATLVFGFTNDVLAIVQKSIIAVIVAMFSVAMIKK